MVTLVSYSILDTLKRLLISLAITLVGIVLVFFRFLSIAFYIINFSIHSSFFAFFSP